MEPNKKIYIVKSLLRFTIKEIKKFGNQFLEGFVLWVGIDNPNSISVKEVWIPKQENTSISYYLSEEEVHHINVNLNKLKLIPVAQVHSHPGFAFHSSIDDEYAILRLPNSYSIVLPNFGDIKVANIFEKGVVFQLIGSKWKKLSKEEVMKRFKIL